MERNTRLHAGFYPDKKTSCLTILGSMSCTITALYKFVKIPDPGTVRDKVYAYCQERGVLGTLLLASEGINGTIAGGHEEVEATLCYLRSYPCFHDMEHRESYATACPFSKLKVKVKSEIVTMGRPDISPFDQVGEYVDPLDWHQILDDSEVTVIDVRNAYETAIGGFAGALNPAIKSFGEFETWATENLSSEKHKKVAMYCTGGIRCEKAVSLIVGNGFKHVFQLKGGILKYLEEILDEDNRWRGECFVFDNRVSINRYLQRGDYIFCMSCGCPIRVGEEQMDHGESGLMCTYCKTTTKMPATWSCKAQRTQ